MKINKKRLIATVLDLIVIIGTIILTPIAIKDANTVRGYEAVGGEYLLPIVAIILIMIIETIYEESKNKKNNKKNKRK